MRKNEAVWVCTECFVNCIYFFLSLSPAASRVVIPVLTHIIYIVQNTGHLYRYSSPKNENSVIIYSSSSCSKPVWMSLFCRTQRKIFWRMWETEQFWGTIDFHSICFPTMEVNGAPKQPGYKLSSKYLPLCSAEQRNSYKLLEGE